MRFLFGLRLLGGSSRVHIIIVKVLDKISSRNAPLLTNNNSRLYENLQIN